MARRPARVRMRGEGNELAPLDGFAAGPVARRNDNNQQVVDPNTMIDHFAAIVGSDLEDEIDDDTAAQRAEENRITDNFGRAFAAYRRRIDGDGAIYDPTEQIAGPGRAPQALLPAPHLRAGQQGNFRGQVPAHAPRNALVGRDPNMRINGAGHLTDWLQLRRLPAYMLTQIRRLGRDIFAQYAPNTQIEDINMIGWLPGMDEFHSQENVRDHVRWITNNGNEVNRDNMDFGQNVPGYRAQTSLWEVDHFNFLIVRDNHGEYVYGWPRAPRPAIEAAPAVPRLR